MANAGLPNRPGFALLYISREKLYTPPHPPLWTEGIFKGGGVYILRPTGAGFLDAPHLLYAPPPLEGYF